MFPDKMEEQYVYAKPHQEPCTNASAIVWNSWCFSGGIFRNNTISRTSNRNEAFKQTKMVGPLSNKSSSIPLNRWAPYNLKMSYLIPLSILISLFLISPTPTTAIDPQHHLLFGKVDPLTGHLRDASNSDVSQLEIEAEDEDDNILLLQNKNIYRNMSLNSPFQGPTKNSTRDPGNIFHNRFPTEGISTRRLGVNLNSRLFNSSPTSQGANSFIDRTNQYPFSIDDARHPYNLLTSNSFNTSLGPYLDIGDTFELNGTSNSFYNISLPPLRLLNQIRRDLTKQSTFQNPKAVPLLSGSSNQGLIENDAQVIDELKECDRVFISTPGGAKNGTFESPNLVADDGHSLQCIYTFVALKGERAQITFTEFNVRGIPPECSHEYVDLYTEVDGTDVTDLISTPFAGRYCGQIPPRSRISLYGGIAIGYYSDKNSTDDSVRFRGTYNFIQEDRYMVGTPVPRAVCSYTIHGTSKRKGELISPTYPGVYPKDLSCTYKFIGTPGQRIRLEFRDFDIFSGGAHCPFDDVKIYDGIESSSPLIGTYCGQYRYLVVYASEHLMLVTFNTHDRVLETQNRGFYAIWEFSESFVKLDFITKNAGLHIRGTECDQRILSQGLSHGFVFSPNYPFPYLTKIYCRYFIYGVQDPQNLERVKLTFEKFDVPSSTHSEEDTHSVPSSQPSKCGDGYLKIYLKGQELTQQYDKHDYEFCGKEVPHDVSSDGPRVVLVFSSGETQGSGFKARYLFETEYRVPGTPAPAGGCGFIYKSSSEKTGEFNSPRFPSNYPSEINCTYLFVAAPNEQVRIVFDHFKVKADQVNPNDTRGAYGPETCFQDWVEVYNVFRDRPDRLVGRYCEKTAPGPIESHEQAEALKVLLHTDSEGVYSGFKARYMFFTAQSIFGECGGNISQLSSGVLTSPGYPEKYEGPKNREGSNRCNWFLSVRPGNRVLLHFKIFNVEGHPKDRGCPSAAVRIWEDPDGLPVELCGEDSTLQPDQRQFVSVKNLMRMTFITADKSVGDKGFYALWTEVQDIITPACPANYARCEKNPFCIPESLRCDGKANCGSYNGEVDESDESVCGLENEMNVLLIVVLAMSCSSCCFISICLWSQRKRRKRRRLQLRRPPIHVCDNAGARFAAMDSV